MEMHLSFQLFNDKSEVVQGLKERVDGLIGWRWSDHFLQSEVRAARGRHFLGQGPLSPSNMVSIDVFHLRIERSKR